MFLAFILLIIIGGIISALYKGYKDSKHIVAIYDTGKSHRYRGYCMVTFAIHYDDGRVIYDSVEYNSLTYNNYITWNEKHKKN